MCRYDVGMARITNGCDTGARRRPSRGPAVRRSGQATPALAAVCLTLAGTVVAGRNARGQTVPPAPPPARPQPAVANDNEERAPAADLRAALAALDRRERDDAVFRRGVRRLLGLPEERASQAERVRAAVTNPWLVFGFGAQALFMMRFVVQWLASERRKRSVVPVSFWWLSLAGGVSLFVYALHLRDPVFVLGQGLGCAIYLRNLVLIGRRRAGRPLAGRGTPVASPTSPEEPTGQA